MSHSEQSKIVTVFAPAKINLYLHVTGRRDDGYHTLDSLVAFADIGDQIEIEAATDFKFHARGPFSGAFGPKELDASPHSSNLVVQAAWAMAQAAQKIPNIRATLTKNLPLASGIGGGSSDAAALIWGLLEWWGLSPQAHYLPDLMTRLGADVPVCLPCQPARMRGIGEIIDPAPPMSEVPIVLVNPGKPSPTAKVFSLYGERFSAPVELPENLEDFDTLISFLSTQSNDLHRAAGEVVPEIDNALNALSSQTGCALARLSGAGSTCFGLFEHENTALMAVEKIAYENPDWWVKSGWINRPERY